MTQGGVLLRLAVHMLLTGLPLVAGMLLAARAGNRSVPVVLVAGLAGSGAAAMIVFWAFFASPTLGKIVGDLLFVASAAVIVWCLWRGAVSREMLRALLWPLGLWVLGSTFLVFLGLLHGGIPSALDMSSSRFSTPLPSDNTIPYYYAGWFFSHGHHGTPPIFPGNWQFSDRPPLQVGYVLSQESIDFDSGGLTYELIGVTLQQLWIIGLWALMLAARVSRGTRALTVIAVLLSDLAIVNGFYVWPKLLPAAMLLGAAALIITPLWNEVRDSRWGLGLVGALLGLAMLGHGTSVFGVVPLGLIAVWRTLPRWRRLLPALVAALIVLVPWSAYQKYEDPPGNRLTRWALAGNWEINGPGAVHAAELAYRRAGLDGTLDNKLSNIKTVGGATQLVQTVSDATHDLAHGQPAEAVGLLRNLGFYVLLPSLGLLLLSPLAMVIGRLRRRVEPASWSFALRCAGVATVSTVLWCLILFGDPIDLTIIHQGSYLVPILWFCAAIAGLRATYPRLAVGLVTLNAALMLALYVPDITPVPGTRVSWIAAVICGASLVAFIRLALATVERRQGEPEPAGLVARAEPAV